MTFLPPAPITVLQTAPASHSLSGSAQNSSLLAVVQDRTRLASARGGSSFQASNPSSPVLPPLSAKIHKVKERAACLSKGKRSVGFHCFYVCFEKRVLLCGLDCSQTWYPPASTPKVQGSQTCRIIPRLRKQRSWLHAQLQWCGWCMKPDWRIRNEGVREHKAGCSTGRIPNPDLQPCIQQAHSLCTSLHCPSPQPRVLLQTRRGSFYIPQL